MLEKINSAVDLQKLGLNDIYLILKNYLEDFTTVSKRKECFRKVFKHQINRELNCVVLKPRN